ncbi:toll/interleukin-1 receptor domain-containing protein [uncultured Hyphomicrobium sp.]|uniref:toll/interleukin-1 receptor domain-containing protein n=1 Tax=uncultured Hyphomicrobium sp. TaxID=194373 RepID=UPI0025EFC33D|nr:toll/interleukin-1 receptor domain-containing protein [uncultured Hyphomicrobium sp.]
MTGRIFINYRRGDDAGTVGRLFDRLEQALGRDTIFMDVEGHIKAGDDYVDVLRAQVSQCDILIAVIGPRWLTMADETGRRRLENPEDWVRVEVVSALEAGAKKRVIPVLVPGGEMPRADDLPGPLKPLARKQAVRITLERFNADAQGLVSQIRGVLDDLAMQRAATEVERAATHESERQREADDKARLAAVEARAREQRASGMSAADVRKAEELANWDFIKAQDDPDDLRDHLARFSGGSTERYARARLGELTFKTLSSSSSIEELQSFLEAFPTSKHESAVQAWLTAAEAIAKSQAEAANRNGRETAAWAAVATSSDQLALQEFLSQWPDGAHFADAQARLRELIYEQQVTALDAPLAAGADTRWKPARQRNLLLVAALTSVTAVIVITAALVKIGLAVLHGAGPPV